MNMRSEIGSLSVFEFVNALKNLKAYQENAVKKITVPMVKFVYLCSDMYNVLKLSFFSSPELMQVFWLLDLVAPPSDFALSDECEKKACALFAFLDNAPVLEFLWVHGFYWDEDTLLNAIRGKSNACFNFALENDCTVTSFTHREMIQFVRHYGTPEMLESFWNW